MDDWVQELDPEHPQQAEALERLRLLLIRGLRAGLSGKAATDGVFVEDIAQVSLLRIIDRRHTFAGKSSFESWALVIAFRLAYNELRRKEWSNVSLDELQEQQADLPDQHSPDLSPDRAAAANDRARLLRELITASLTPRQQQVILCELSGMPQEEIARQLDTTRNNVYKIFHDARKALKRALEKQGHSAQSLFGDALPETSA